MKKFLFLTAIAGLLFTGCGKETTPDDDPGIAKNPTGDAWISLDISSLGTRALHNPDKETGTAVETTVGSVRAIFFNAAGTVVTKDMTLSTAEMGNPDQPEGDAGKAFKVPVTSKRILIIANPHAGLPGVGTFTTYADFNKALTATAADLSADNKFLMTNAKGGLEPSNATGAGVDLVLYNSPGKAEATPLHIAVDRVVAKVRVYYASAASTNAALSNQGWILNVTNKKYFPVSERIKTKMGTATPYDKYKLGSYRIDPNYGGISGNVQPDAPAAGNDWTAYKAEYNYYSDDNAAFPTIGAGDWKTNGVAVYCLENTQNKLANVDDYNTWAYTTQVLFKVTFSPTGLQLPDGSVYNDPTDNVTAGALTAGNDWISVNASIQGVAYKGYYTWKLLMLWITEELTNKYTDKKPAEYNTTLANALNAYLTSITAGAVTIPQVYDDTTYPGPTGPADQAAAIVALFNAKQAAVVAAGAGSEGAFSYYKSGVNYYPIMIKHDDSSTVYNELGEFGVVRNSVYDVNITSVNNPGYPTIPDPDPKTPDESDENYLAVKIDVNPWTWYSQEEPL